MDYKSSIEVAKEWKVSERTVRYYCSNGRVKGAVEKGKSWLIPKGATKPERKERKVIRKNSNLLEILQEERAMGLRGGIYHKLQIEMTYNSNHIEGSKLTRDQTKYIFETNLINSDGTIRIDDLIESVNHFRCIDLVIENANYKLNESFIKQLHRILKSSTTDASKSWFRVGEYKLLENEVGDVPTTKPEKVKEEMQKLLANYNNIKNVTIEDIIKFHNDFEHIHPFQDGNGRVGRLIMLKECLKYNYVPILITDDIKLFYYRGLKEWNNEKGYLIDTCLAGQDIMKKYLDKFHIVYK